MEPRSSNHEAATSVPTAALSAHQTQAVSVPVTTITVATTPVVSAMRPQFACQVPSITKLRHELGYGNAKLHRCEAFYDNMRVFRKRYITKSQVKSTDLQNWKWSNQQKFLNEMTREFLEVRKHGYEFWPDNSSNANYNELRYTNDEDRRRIQKNIGLLFFRLNQQDYRNKKYGNRQNLKPTALPEPQFGHAGNTSGMALPAPIAASSHETTAEGDITPESVTANIVFIYRVILSRAPIYSFKGWYPSGRFDELTLREITEAISLRSDVRHVVFTVDSATLKGEEKIHRDDEKGFESFKRYIAKIIRDQHLKNTVVEVDIEPIGEQTAVANEELDSEDFVF